MMTKYKNANALLKTEPEMRNDYSIADYPYSKETYDYFVSLNQSKPAQVNTKSIAGTRDKNGNYKPADEIAQLGKELRDLFDKNKRR
jgi:hypothetical protein